MEKVKTKAKNKTNNNKKVTLKKLEKYLIEINMNGVGESTIKKIVETFKGETIRVIKYEPKKLTQIKGITERKAKKINKNVIENCEFWNKVNVIEKDKKEEDNKLLIISEVKEKVYLPYTQSDIEKYIRKREFDSKEEVINKIFTVPLSKYSNTTFSRVSEGFKLMKEKEKASFVKSLNYAFSLANERKLHPAVITACKTMDDLDIYLACLEDNVLSLFDAFEVKFEYRPLKVQQKKHGK